MVHGSNAGYAHSSYAESLVDFGQALPLPRSHGWLLKRPVDGSSIYDASHCYPLLVCQDWSQLKDDLDALSEQVVSIVAVTDPLGEYSPTMLADAFPDLCRVYKKHFLVDLRLRDEEFVCAHHARYAKKALNTLRIATVNRPIDYLDTWISLYDTLVCRHEITGVARFSRESFRKQLAVPGCVLSLAESQGEVVGMQIWYHDRQVGYYHLAAYSERGYGLRASFGLFSLALSEFRERGARYLALGAGAGTFGSSDGLARFKRGWSSETRPAFLCGRICNRAEYRCLTDQFGGAPEFFPAYRSAKG